MNINIQRLERMRLRGSGATKERELDARSLEKKYKNDELIMIMIMMIVFILEYVKGAKLGREIGAAAARLAGGKVGLKVFDHL